jgi:hypothetical protein
MQMMPGVPPYLYYLAVIVVMIVSFVLFVNLAQDEKTQMRYLGVHI